MRARRWAAAACVVGSPLLLSAAPASAGDAATFRFTAAEMSVGEGAGVATVTVEKIGAGGPGGSVTVSTSPGSATAPSDYSTVSTVAVFGAGPGTRTVDIPITNDAVTEPTETFTAALSAPSQGTVLGAPSSMTITITDNDTEPPASIHFAASTLTVGEGAGSASITVFRTGQTNSTARATFSLTDGTATAGSDHNGAGGTVLFDVGDGVESILVPIVQDSVDEPDETFSLTITAVSPGAVIGTPSMITVTIADDEPSGPTIGFASPGLSVGESAGTVELELVCGPGTDASTSATVTLSGSAEDADADVLGAATCPGVGVESLLAIEVDDDDVAEAGETLVVTLSDPTDGAELEPFTTFTLTIDPSDVQPDAAIGREPTGSYRGIGLINGTGIGQTSGGSSRYPLEGRTRYIRIAHDIDSPLRAVVRRNAPENIEIRVFLLLPDGSERDISDETLSGYRIELSAGDVARLRVTMRFERLLRDGVSRGAAFTVSRTSDVIRRDVVRFRLTQR